MARPRLPIEKARLTGADKKHPERFRNRHSPAMTGRTLGQPPDYLDAKARTAWQLLADEMPWLVHEDRALVEATACQRAAIIDDPGSLTMAFLRAYRQALSSLGATPVDRQRLNLPPPEPDDDRFDYFT